MNARKKSVLSLLAAVLALALLAGCGQGAASQPASAAPGSAAANASSAQAAPANEPPAGTPAAGDITLDADALATLESLTKVDDNFYRLDYALDDLLAKGAGSAAELGVFVSGQVLGGLPFHQQAPSLSCSAFTAVTPDGDYIHGRNLDIADAQNVLVRTRPENGYESLSVASGLLLGYTDAVPDSLLGQMFMLAAPYYPVDGINEKGVSVAILMLSESVPVAQDTGKPPITTTMAVRLILDKAASVEEAIALLDEYDMHSINNVNIHFQIADATGDSAVIEYVNSEMQVLRSTGNGQAVTNFFLSPNADEKLFDGEDRLEILQGALDEGEGVIAPDKAMQMLDSVKLVHVYDEPTGIDFNTSYSTVFNNTKRTLEICVNMEYDVAYSFAVGQDFS